MSGEPTSSEQLPEPLKICAEFRREWTEQSRRNIPELLARVDTPERSDLLSLLLQVEVDQLAERGLEPNCWDYYPLAPGDRRVIDHVLRQVGERPAAKGSTPEMPVATSEPLTDSSPAADDTGRYRLDERLGSGSFGDVYRATDMDLHREVAIKVLRLEQNSLDEVLREARVAAALKHPAVVTVHDLVRRDNGTGWIVMEYVSGLTLEQMFSQKELPLDRVLAILATVADGLKHAHMSGLVHRDLKPANILIDDQFHPHIADFGLALRDEEQVQRNVEVAGTPYYMAPEQIRGETHLLDGRCDIWALGVILYEALTGVRPFHGRTRREVYDEIQRKDPKPPRMIDGSLPQAIEQICLKCLAKNAVDRYTNAGDLAAELNAARAPSESPTPQDDSAGVLRDAWEMLDPDLQDAFSLAYNKKRRLGKNRISTKDLFQALMRIQDRDLLELIQSLPEGAMPEPIDGQLAPDQTVVEEDPLLSDCVRDSLRAFAETPKIPRKLSPTDILVDIGKHGHGPSVRKLRDHGVDPEGIDQRVEELGLKVVQRSSRRSP